MQLHADFTKRAVIHGAELEWKASPIAGVNRRMLDRIGGEVARATTIVRFDAGSRFDPHTHGGGEEFFVLEGVFQDEHGDYPAGTYIRNPPTSRHTPGSDEGCTILVKLWQFDPDDRTFVTLDTEKMEAFADPDRAGIEVRPLFQDDRETVRLENWPAETSLPIGHVDGAEYFVLGGGYSLDGEAFSRSSWLRLPAGQSAEVSTGPQGATIWSKTGHLIHAVAPDVR